MSEMSNLGVVKVLEVWKTVKHVTWGYEHMPHTPSSPRKF